ARRRAAVPVRPAERAVPRAAEPGRGGARGQHARGLGELRGDRRPGDGGRAVAVLRRRRRHQRALAEHAAVAGRERLAGGPPLRVLGRGMTTQSTSIRPQVRTIDGLRIRFAESEGRDREQHALLFCPWPESLYAYDQMWGRLAEHAHLVAV